MAVPDLIVEAAFASSTGAYLILDDVSRGLLDTAQLGPDSGVWTDITQYVHRITIRRGANRVESPILRYEAGTCTIELNNSDRRFDPTNLSGPYVSAGLTQVTPMRGVRVRAVWADVVYNLFYGFADRWEIGYDEPNYSRATLQATDGTKVLTANSRGAVAAVGAGEDSGGRVTRILNSASWPVGDRLIVGGDTLLQDTTLEGNTWNELLLVQDTEIGEVYVDAAGRVVFRNRQAAVEDLRSNSAMATFSDLIGPITDLPTVNLCRNPSIETDLTDWVAGGSAPPTLTQSSAQAQFGTKSLLCTWATGGFLPLVQYTLTGASVGRIYTFSVYVRVPAGSPDVVVTVANTSIFGDSTSLKDQWVRLTWTGSAIASTLGLQIWPLSAPAAGQQLFVDGLQFEQGSTASTYCDGDQVTCEWDGIAHASASRRLPGLPYADLALDYDDSTLYNLIRVTRVGGAEQVVQDAASIQLYLTHTFERSDLIMQTDTAALDYANFILYQSAEPELRFSELLVIPARDETSLFPEVLGREFGDRIRIVRTPPGGGAITREVYIRGVSHNIEPGNGSWRTLWTLQSATKYQFLVVSHSTLGLVGTGRVGF